MSSNFAVSTDLSALPVGWHSVMTAFACETVSAGNGCQLTLDHAPTAADSGILTLALKYTDSSGAEKGGSAAVSYVSSSDNNIVGAVAPSGQITALVGAAQTLAVTFTTDDGAPASAFSITSSVSALLTTSVSGYDVRAVAVGNGYAYAGGSTSTSPTSTSRRTCTYAWYLGRS